MGKSMKFFDDMGRKTCQLIPIFPIFCVIHENQKNCLVIKDINLMVLSQKNIQMFLN